MNWHGIGITAAGAAPPRSATSPERPLARLEPTSAWTGLAGSGFSTVPSDPLRTTAKPALRLITPPFQNFTDTIDVGVVALANSGGTLIGGIDRVRFHFEGASIDVLAPQFHEFVDARGERVSYFGYWAQLKRPANGSGTGQLYVRAIPSDATMQNRVIGPFIFSPVAIRYDRALTVAPSLPQIVGSCYQTLNAAVQYAKSQGDQNPLITITQPGFYAIADSSPTAYNRSGYFNITASVPGVKIGYANPPTPAVPQSVMECARLKLHLFGPNITIDFANFSILQGDTNGVGNDHWLDGITITNSNGRDSFYKGGIRGGGTRVRGNAWFTECTISELEDSVPRSSLIRGCNGTRLMNNCVNVSGAIIQSSFNDHSTGFFNNNDPAFSVVYTGTETVATIAKRGGAQGFDLGDGLGMYRVTIGSTVYDFVVGDGSENYWNRTAGNGFTFGDVVTWLNTLPGVTATLLVQDNRMAASGGLGPETNSDTQFGTKGQGWGFPANNTKTALSIKTLRTIRSYFDFHGDWYQHGTGTLENVIVWGNRVWNVGGQLVFLSPTGSSPAQRDVFFVGNGFHRPNSPATGATDGEGNASQWGRPGTGNLTISHVVFAHNSWAGQRLLLRGGTGNVIDDRTMLKNCALPAITIDAAGWSGKDIAGLHLPAGAVTGAIGVDYSKEGATSYDFYVNAAAGDFSPATPLLNNRWPPVVAFDLDHHGPSPAAAKGAILSS